MPTLNWLLKTSGLKNIKLLTSPTSLNTPISSVNVLDNPDVLKWFQRDELILTTGFVFKEHPEMMATSIKALKEAGCCALGIKVPRYFRTVPEELLQLATEYELPLLELPFFYSFSEIMHCVFRQVDKEAMPDAYPLFPTPAENHTNGFLQFLLSHSEYAPGKMRELCTFYGFPYLKGWVCLTIEIRALPAVHKNAVTQILQGLLAELDAQKLSIIPYGDENIFCAFFIFPNGYHALQAVKEVEAVAVRLRLRMQHVTKVPLPAGFSSYHTKITGIQQAFAESLQALHLPRSTERPTSYLHLLPLQIMGAVNPGDRHTLIDNLLQPLLAYDQAHDADLLATLESYLEQDGNVSATAKVLFLHRNTMISRLHKIKELLQMELNNSQEILLLKLALLARQFEQQALL